MNHIKPHLIIHNARIYQPLNSSAKPPTALAVVGDRIAALGSEEDILALRGAQTLMLDASGRWLLPALIDSHVHLSCYAERKLRVDLSECQSLGEGLAKVQAELESAPVGSWVTGGGWDKSRWGLPDFPDKKLLDGLSERHYIALDSKDWHTMWVNSNVLRVCGIDDTTADPPGGRIRRYPGSREPSGTLQEKAREVVRQSIAPPALMQIYPVLKETFSEFQRLGITAVHSVESPYEFAHYNQLFEEGKLGLRVFWYFPERYLTPGEEQEFSPGMGNHFIKICGVKMFSDGALGSQTADMLENYQQLDHRGVAVMSDEELREKVRLSVKQRLSCAIHAIGDRANRRVLNVLGAVSRESRAQDLRHRIEHAQLLHPDDLPRFSKYGVIASMQPLHLSADVPLIEQYWGERGRYAYAFNSLLKHRARLIFGSDTPIESFDPWTALYTALQRKPEVNPGAKTFYPEENISLREALDAYTVNSAYAVGEEQHLGALEKGKFADLILLDRDIFHEPAESLLETRVVLTVQAGRAVYRTF